MKATSLTLASKENRPIHRKPTEKPMAAFSLLVHRLVSYDLNKKEYDKEKK